MSGHFAEIFTGWLRFAPFAVLGVSLLGSGHCVAMCGGLVVAVARNRRAMILYQLGRLAGYVSLGFLAGLLGAVLLDLGEARPLAWVHWLSTCALAIGFTFLGIRLWIGRPVHFSLIPKPLLSRLYRLGPGMAGLLSAFLPCGWLHAFVLSAVAMRSAPLGAAYLFCFWLGTLPALSFAPFVATRMFRPLAVRLPRVSAAILIVIGVGSIAYKMWPEISPQSHPHCHEGSAEMTSDSSLETADH